MRKNGVRVLLTLAFLLTIASLVIDYRLDNQIAEQRLAVIDADRDLARLESTTAELRAAQNAYVAAGQGHAFWIDRVAELSTRLNTELTRVRERATNAETRTRLEAAAVALGDLQGADTRAREYITNDQRLLASDIIFVDAASAAQRFTTEIADARTAESGAVNRGLENLRNTRLAANAGGLVLVLVLGMGAARLNREPVASEAADVVQMIRTLPPAVKPPVITAPVIPPPAPAVAAKPAAVAPAPPPAPVVSLPEAAELCVDFARVIDGRDIPGLLERTGRLLDARGLIVWVADSEGSTLHPMLTHGYAEKVIKRLGTLDASADNVTSLAFRSARPQLMNGGPEGASGALAVPLVTASGCTGVLAAEIKDGRPAPETLAIARIVAAQLATIVAPQEVAEATGAAEA